MANIYASLVLFFLFSCFSFSSRPLALPEIHNTYIVHVSNNRKPAAFKTDHQWYSEALLGSLPHKGAFPARILYTYHHATQGFAARLSLSQARALRHLPGVLSVVRDRILHLQTTRSPGFLGLRDGDGIWPNSDYADDIVIGVLDSGIWPEHRSFSDEGISSAAENWQGACETGPDFPAASCNRKLVGAKAFYKGYEQAYGAMDETVESKSPRDTEGHGTHTASIAAGASVPGAEMFGLAAGEARGVAIKARIAAYKICWLQGCLQSDILAGMDKAVADGVHVISLSISLDLPPVKYHRDPIAVGAFGAVQHGIVVSCAAGNFGPYPSTALNIAPWLLTVGASTMDREFPADVLVGDGSAFTGTTLYSGDPPLPSSYLPLFYGSNPRSRRCSAGSFNRTEIAGKIVLCDYDVDSAEPVETSNTVMLAGGAGLILANSADYGEVLMSNSYLIPGVMVGYSAGDMLRAYARSQLSPTASIIFRGTVVSPSPAAPAVAAVSGRGPNALTAEILKPDVIAPGVNILAAWTGAKGPSGLGLDLDTRRVEFNIETGTSMACPHVSGLAALLRKAHPQWSPSAIKSALMTTAYTTDNAGGQIKDAATGEDASPFMYGAGHVHPNRALQPGLVYDSGPDDFVSFLCAAGYRADQIAVFVKGEEQVNCSVRARPLRTAGDLNYPSFSVVFKSARGSEVTYRRVVTNVGPEEKPVYEVEVLGPSGVEIRVSPSRLEFREVNESLAYNISFTSVVDPAEITAGESRFGSVSWSDGVHIVRSPIAFSWRKKLSWASI